MLNKSRSLERLKRRAANLSKGEESCFAEVLSRGNVLPLALKVADI